jgi:hypothetical protein
MRQLKIEIKRRNLDFGIITWPYEQDNEARTFFDNKEKITLEFDDRKKSDRKISYKYRRFSFGKKKMKGASDKRFFVITREDKGPYKVSFK